MEESELRAQLRLLHDTSFGWALNCCSLDRGEAEDVLQTAYLKILQGRARFEGRSSFKTWLFAVIHRTAADERRRRWFRHLGLVRYIKEREVEEAPVGGAAADREEMAKIFRNALGRLPRRQREVLHLVFYQELSIEEASEVMNVGVGSARLHYERGKENLRKHLDRWGNPKQKQGGACTQSDREDVS